MTSEPERTGSFLPPPAPAVPRRPRRYALLYRAGQSVLTLETHATTDAAAREYLREDARALGEFLRRVTEDEGWYPYQIPEGHQPPHG